MEAQTIQKYIHTTPRKLRLVADMIRKLSPAKAMEALRFTNKAAAKDLMSAIKVVLANAKQAGLKEEKTVFNKIEINEGSRMKRFRAGAKGRARPFKRRMSHIKIVVSDQGIVNSQIKEIKEVTKKVKGDK